MSFPTKNEALEELYLAEKLNPGKWVYHSEKVAEVCEKIAQKCGLDVDKAYIFGLLHDIGRRVGICGQYHIYAGYVYCMNKGWNEVAKISLTHSYMLNDANIGCSVYDGSDEEWKFIEEYIRNIKYDEYDMLVQLADSMVSGDGICTIERRMVDVAMRYGIMPEMLKKWLKIFDLKRYFDAKCGQSVYDLFPEVKENLE